MLRGLREPLLPVELGTSIDASVVEFLKMKEKSDTPKLKALIEDLEKIVDSDKFRKTFEMEHKDLEDALTLLKSVRRRIKAKNKES